MTKGAPTMARLLGALLVCIGIAVPAAPAACTFFEIRYGVEPNAPHGTAPRPARILSGTVDRGFCYDIGILSIRLGGSDADAHGYRLAIVDGIPPPGLRLTDRPYAASDGKVTVTWVDADAALRRAFHFTIAVTVVDRAGRTSQPVFIRVDAGARPRRPTRPRERPIPPVLWIAGFAGLFGLGAIAGQLRRPRVEPD